MLQRCKILGRTIGFTLEYIEIRKHFLKYHSPPPPPLMCQQKLLPVYVLLYFTYCMEPACWHKGGGEVFSSPKIQARKMPFLPNKK